MSQNTENASNDKNVEEQWLEASDWDDPLKVALLYKDPRSISCGHAVQWIPRRLVDAKSCPICDEPVSFICNGGPPSTGDRFLYFKFGKQAYRLNLIQQQQPQSQEETSDHRSLKNWLSSFLAKYSFTSAANSKQVVLAQNRIQWALNLADGFKILYKGKVLYPPANATKSSSSSSLYSPESISESLQELSNQEQPTTSPTLVVMGTLKGRELPSRPPDSSTTRGWTWFQLAQLPFAIVFWGIHSAWVFARTLLSPFLPESMLGNHAEPRQRPHND